MKKFFVLSFIAAIIVSITGCETMKSDKDRLKPGVHYRLSVHQIVKYPKATKIEKALPTIEGDKRVWVNMNYFIDSRSFKESKLVEVQGQPGMYNLSLELSERGVMQWLQLSNGFVETPLALVCDGKVLTIFTIKDRTNEETTWISIDEPIDFVNAKLVHKYVAHNYKFYTE